MVKKNLILQLQSSWTYYEKNGVCELSSSIRQQRIRMRGLDRCVAQNILGLLEKGVEAETASAEIAERIGLPQDKVERILNQLKKKDVVVVTDKMDSEMEIDPLYDRQIRFFKAFEKDGLSGYEMNQNLQNKKVLIVGLGGYGSWLALLCARMGIRNIIAVDGDRVESTNLNRQIIYTKEHVNMLKVEAFRHILKQTDDRIDYEGIPIYIKSVAELVSLMEGVDFVFNSFGYLPERERHQLPWLIAEAAQIARVPSIAFTGSWVGPLNLPGKNACYGCVVTDSQFETAINASQPVPGRRFDPAFVPRIAMSAVLAVWEASRFLSGMDSSPAMGNLIQLDTFHYHQHRLIPIFVKDHCPICNGRKRDA